MINAEIDRMLTDEENQLLKESCNKHLLELYKNAEGHTLAIISPLKDDKPQDGFRLAGPKAWGGYGRLLGKVVLSTDDLRRYLKDYCDEAVWPPPNRRDMEPTIQQRLIDLLNAVGHIGVDFGHGRYELSADQIEEAQKLYAMLSAEPPKVALTPNL